MSEPERCLKCLRLQRTKHKQTAKGCRLCGRWQSLHQAAFITFGGVVYQHLACVACGQGAWCRDFVGGPDATACAYFTHVHAVGECPGGFA
jgi:hypothetical protein